MLTVAAVTAGALDVVADRDARHVLGALADERLPRGTGPAALRPDQIRYHLVAARAAGGRQTPSGFAAALARLDDAHGLSPRDPVVENERSLVLLQRAELFGDDASIDAARTALRRLARDDPHNAEVKRRLKAADALQKSAANGT
ncbi:MAG: hypothetical protein H0W70_08060 [Actinobacteria bacterium]|nr:hypothetical protein [Actinomycetota bacterium]